MSKGQDRILAALEDAGYEHPEIRYVIEDHGWWFGDMFLGGIKDAMQKISSMPNPDTQEIPWWTGQIDDETHPEIYDSPTDAYGNPVCSPFATR